MPSLLDIVELTETVEIGQTKLDVYPISARGIADLLGRFPALRMMITGYNAEPEDLMKAAPDAIAAIIAMGVRDERPEMLQAAGNLSAELQLDLLAAIMRLTMPSGLGPFVEKFGRIMDGAAQPMVPVGVVADPGKAAGTNSPRR